jgi:hypothetical protein
MPRNTYPLDKSRPWFLIGTSDLSAKNGCSLADFVGFHHISIR